MPSSTAITPGGPCPPPNCPLFDDLTWTTSGPQEAPPYPCFPGQEYDSQSQFSNYRESKRSPWMFPLKSALSGPDVVEAALHPTPRGPCTVFPREFLLIFNLFPHSDLASHPCSSRGFPLPCQVCVWGGRVPGSLGCLMVSLAKHLLTLRPGGLLSHPAKQAVKIVHLLTVSLLPAAWVLGASGIIGQSSTLE